MRQRLARFKRSLKHTAGELRKAVWCLQEARGLKGMASLGYVVVRPEVGSDLVLVVPKHLQSRIGHSVLRHRRWMACQLGTVLVANLHWPVARATATVEMEEAQQSMVETLLTWPVASQPAQGCLIGGDFNVTAPPSESHFTGPRTFSLKQPRLWGPPHWAQQASLMRVMASLDLVAVNTFGPEAPPHAAATWFRPPAAGCRRVAYSQLDYWLAPAPPWIAVHNVLREEGWRFSDHLPLSLRISAPLPICRPRALAWPMTGWQTDSHEEEMRYRRLLSPLAAAPDGRLLVLAVQATTGVITAPAEFHKSLGAQYKVVRFAVDSDPWLQRVHQETLIVAGSVAHTTAPLRAWKVAQVGEEETNCRRVWRLGGGGDRELAIRMRVKYKSLKRE